mmetsp:Transcript_36721/g.109090  ORF Transcript_36721/g.109090 Transcript_36721/m.109090 type:complete len:386 (+) Transcript_36721:10-1167(+)
MRVLHLHVKVVGPEHLLHAVLDPTDVGQHADHVEALGGAPEARSPLEERHEGYVPFLVLDEVCQLGELLRLDVQRGHPGHRGLVPEQRVELVATERPVPIVVHAREQHPHLLVVRVLLPLLSLNHDLVVLGRRLHRLLHEDRRDDAEDREAHHAAVEEEKHRVPLADVVDEDAAGGSPVRERHLEHGEHGPREGSVVRVHEEPRVQCLAVVQQVLTHHLGEHHARDALDDDEQAHRPEERRHARRHALEEQRQGVEGPAQLHHPESSLQLHHAEEPQHHGVDALDGAGHDLEEGARHGDDVEPVQREPEVAPLEEDQLQEDLDREEEVEGSRQEGEEVLGPRPALLGGFPQGQSPLVAEADQVPNVEARVLHFERHEHGVCHDEE